MSFHRSVDRLPFILRAFRENDNHLTAAQLVDQEVGGTYWRQELGAMRKRGYVLIEEASGDWFLEASPEVSGAGRAADIPPHVQADGGAETRTDGIPAKDVGSSPSTEPLPLFTPEPPPARSPYDENEAA